jgi:hypothetical protein
MQKRYWIASKSFANCLTHLTFKFILSHFVNHDFTIDEYPISLRLDYVVWYQETKTHLFVYSGFANAVHCSSQFSCGLLSVHIAFLFLLAPAHSFLYCLNPEITKILTLSIYLWACTSIRSRCRNMRAMATGCLTKLNLCKFWLNINFLVLSELTCTKLCPIFGLITFLHLLLPTQ